MLVQITVDFQVRGVDLEDAEGNLRNWLNLALATLGNPLIEDFDVIEPDTDDVIPEED